MKFYFWIGLLLIWSSFSANSQQPLIDPGQRLQEEQQRLLRERELKRAPSSLPSPQEILEPSVEDGPSFMVKSIIIRNQKRIPKVVLSTIIDQYQGRELSFSDINKLINDLTNACIAKGYVTTRFYIAPQNIASGTLELLCIEGNVGAVVQNKGSYRDEWEMWMAFPTEKGDILRLPALEQGLDQLNRLPSSRAKMVLVPGNEIGESTVAVANDRINPFRTFVGYDNLGQVQSGKERYRLGLEVDSLLALNEAWAFNLFTSENTNALAASVNVPFGWWNFYQQFSYSEYLVPLGANAELFGQFMGSTTGLTQVVYRDSRNKTTLDCSVALKDSDRFLNDIKLTTTPLTVLKINASHLYRADEGLWVFELGYSAGLPIFGAKPDLPDTRYDTPKSLFNKLEASVTHSRQITDWLGFRSTVSAQYAFESLFSSEQLVVGDFQTVRGFTGSSVAGEDGLLMRNELPFSLPANTGYEVLDFTLRNLQPYAFFDLSYTEVKAKVDGVSLGGTGLGVRFLWDRLTADACWGHAVWTDRRVENRENEFYFSLTARIY